MSSAAAYLERKLKPALVELAEASNLPDYTNYLKADLVEALDEHLQRNATKYEHDSLFSEYYSKLARGVKSPTKSPTKRSIAEKVSDMIKPEDDDSAMTATAKKAVRRRTKSPEDMSSDTDGPITALTKTPLVKEAKRRVSILQQEMPSPPSPAVVADVIEQQSQRVRRSISDAYDRAGIHEYSEQARSTLSSSIAVNVMAVMIEAYGLLTYIFPKDVELFKLPAVPYVLNDGYAVRANDLFRLLTPDFWGPFSLWLLTSLAIPAIVSYFVNIPLKQLPARSHARREGMANPRLQFDAFTFNITKGLLAYLVFANHSFWPTWLHTPTSSTVVAEYVPFGWQGMVIASVIGASVSMYEATLKGKH